jgi:ketosteroid isomerase-like protein
MHSFMSPRETLGLWIDAFNAADVDRLAELYHEDAVNHQVANAPVEGREAIRELFAVNSPRRKWCAFPTTSCVMESG